MVKKPLFRRLSDPCHCSSSSRPPFAERSCDNVTSIMDSVVEKSCDVKLCSMTYDASFYREKRSLTIMLLWSIRRSWSWANPLALEVFVISFRLAYLLNLDLGKLTGWGWLISGERRSEFLKFRIPRALHIVLIVIKVGYFRKSIWRFG